MYVEQRESGEGIRECSRTERTTAEGEAEQHIDIEVAGTEQAVKLLAVAEKQVKVMLSIVNRSHQKGPSNSKFSRSG